MTREALALLLDLSLLVVPGIVGVSWWWTLRAWRRLALSTYWNAPLRTLHAYAVMNVVSGLCFALHTSVELRVLYPGDTYMTEQAWGGMPLSLYAWAALYVLPALMTGVFVLSTRPRRSRPAGAS